MSTILKALRRLEQEGESTRPELSLPEEVLAEPGQPLVRQSAGRIWRILASGLAAAALLAFFVWRMAPELPVAEPGPVAAASAPATPGVAAAPAPEAAAAARSLARATAPAAGEQEPALAAGGRAPLPGAGTAPAAPAPTGGALGARPGAGPVVAAALASGEASGRAPAVPPAPRAAKSAAPPAPPIRTAAAKPPSRAAPATQPPATRRQRSPAKPPAVTVAKRSPPRSGASARLAAVQPPKVRVLRTEWHPKSERRRAQVALPGLPEPVKVREGDVVGTLVVAQIEPSAVLFRHGDRLVRHAVGSPR